MPQPLFFESSDGARLFGVWRTGSIRDQRRFWVVCAPFAEEDKAARRTLTEICEALAGRGEPSLVFAYRGTGDSSGDFAAATLIHWQQDILAACVMARQLAKDAGAASPSLGLIGVRLGAALALQVAKQADVEQLLLIEPIVSGRTYLAQMNRRKQLRGMITTEQQTEAGAATTVETVPTSSLTTTDAIEDLDGWPLSAGLRSELQALDLLDGSTEPPAPGRLRILQVGPRSEVAVPLKKLAEKCGCVAQAVVMQPFWNLLDYVKPEPLLQAVLNPA